MTDIQDSASPRNTVPAVSVLSTGGAKDDLDLVVSMCFYKFPPNVKS